MQYTQATRAVHEVENQIRMMQDIESLARDANYSQAPEDQRPYHLEEEITTDSSGTQMGTGNYERIYEDFHEPSYYATEIERKATLLETYARKETTPSELRDQLLATCSEYRVFAVQIRKTQARAPKSQDAIKALQSTKKDLESLQRSAQSEFNQATARKVLQDTEQTTEIGMDLLRIQLDRQLAQKVVQE